MAPGWIDHLLILTLATLFPIRARTFGFRRLTDAAAEDVPRVRSALYAQAMVLQWGLVAIVIAWWAGQARPWAALGLVPRATPWFAALSVLAIVVAPLAIARALRARQSPRTLDAVRAQIGHIERMLPRTAAEMKTFVGLAITAGLCEELLFRGYVMWYLGHWLGPLPSLAVTSLLFGLGHSYQGLKGIVLTGVIGAALGGICLAAGCLYPAMVLHAVGDIQSGLLGQAAVREQEAAEV